MNDPDRELLRLVLIILAIVTILTLFLYLFFPEAVIGENASGQQNAIVGLSVQNHQECFPGTRSQCINYMNCFGYKLCREGKWSECIVQKVCTPGTKTGCFLNYCSMGYATCNACGTGYENCTP